MQYATLQAAVVEDCLTSGKAFASLSCDGQASMPSFSSEFADALTQVSSLGFTVSAINICVSLHGNCIGACVP